MLSEIPYRITKTNLYAGLYDGEGSERLHAQSSKLYETILEAVGLMLDWIAHRSTFSTSRLAFVSDRPRKIH